jgi:hypothetical protein
METERNGEFPPSGKANGNGLSPPSSEITISDSSTENLSFESSMILVGSILDLAGAMTRSMLGMGIRLGVPLLANPVSH